MTYDVNSYHSNTATWDDVIHRNFSYEDGLKPRLHNVVDYKELSKVIINLKH